MDNINAFCGLADADSLHPAHTDSCSPNPHSYTYRHDHDDAHPDADPFAYIHPYAAPGAVDCIW